MCLLLVINCASAQQAHSLQPLTPADYLQKSKRQKTGAWLLTGTGAAILFITVGHNALAGLGPNMPSFPIVGVLLGSGSIVGGISLFKASARNRRKAMDVSVELIAMTKILPPQNR